MRTKRFFSWLVTIAMVLSIMTVALPVQSVAAANNTARPTLQFNANGTFNILHLADLQSAGLTLLTDPGANTNNGFTGIGDKTRRFLHALILENHRPAEGRPINLIVLAGDNMEQNQFTGTVNYQTMIRSFMDIFLHYNIPVAVVFGNHDAAVGPGTRRQNKWRQYELYRSYPNSLIMAMDPESPINTIVNTYHGGVGPGPEYSIGNYNLPIRSSDGTNPHAFNLWFFDSGSHNNDGVTEAAMQWYEWREAQLREANGGVPVPSLVFQHIAVPEMRDVIANPFNGGNRFTVTANTATQELTKHNHCHCVTNDSIYRLQYLRHMTYGDVRGMFFGHEHYHHFRYVPTRHRTVFGSTATVPTPAADRIPLYYTGRSSEDRINLQYRSNAMVARMISINETTGNHTTRTYFRQVQRAIPASWTYGNLTAAANALTPAQLNVQGAQFNELMNAGDTFRAYRLLPALILANQERDAVMRTAAAAGVPSANAVLDTAAIYSFAHGGGQPRIGGWGSTTPPGTRTRMAPLGQVGSHQHNTTRPVYMGRLNTATKIMNHLDLSNYAAHALGISPVQFSNGVGNSGVGIAPSVPGTVPMVDSFHGGGTPAETSSQGWSGLMGAGYTADYTNAGQGFAVSPSLVFASTTGASTYPLNNANIGAAFSGLFTNTANNLAITNWGNNNGVNVSGWHNTNNNPFHTSAVHGPNTTTSTSGFPGTALTNSARDSAGFVQNANIHARGETVNRPLSEALETEFPALDFLMGTISLEGHIRSRHQWYMSTYQHWSWPDGTFRSARARLLWPILREVEFVDTDTLHAPALRAALNNIDNAVRGVLNTTAAQLAADSNCNDLRALRASWDTLRSTAINAMQNDASFVVGGARNLTAAEAATAFDFYFSSAVRTSFEERIDAALALAAAHTAGSAATCIAAQTCTDCSFVFAAQLDHVFDVLVQVVAPTCYADGFTIFGCSAGPCNTTENRYPNTNRPAHTFNITNCTVAVQCAHCPAMSTPNANHTFNITDCTVAVQCSNCDAMSTPNTNHTFNITDCTVAVECSNCNVMSTPYASHDFNITDCTVSVQCSRCDAMSTPRAHSGGTATCVALAICDDCGTPYGALDPNNHTGGETNGTRVEPTHTTPGSQQILCSDCGEELRVEVLPVLPPANPVVTWPTGLTATAGQTLADIPLPANVGTPGTFTWTAVGNTPVGSVGTQTHELTFTPNDTAAFNIVTQNVNVVVTPPITTVDFSALNALIAQARDMAQGNYTDASWNALQNALNAAQAVANNPNSTQAQVNGALENLQRALNGLQENQPGGGSGYRYIFTTRFRSNFWNWIMFIFLFGWIWMWFA